MGKFVEFFGPGVATLSIADRATISNMCPEYGATVGFFPVDDMSIAYLKQSGKYNYIGFCFLLTHFFQMFLYIPVFKSYRNVILGGNGVKFLLSTKILLHKIKMHYKGFFST